ncbi:MAG: arabinan endo-1,5-alpha-L-arabinosidase, partial [Planctomycetales bacterium]|nr:arabinan endo-1,5-alpha-L-arabinosidase [Planctomycetales bacterium]
PTLNPADSGYGWKDHGIVVQTDEHSDHNAIDPAIVRTPSGELWMVYGSYWTGIKLFRLDPVTGKRISPDAPTYSLARKEQIEAASIYYHDGYYYLFVNWGHCCRGVRSTYNIRVGRSRAITGPYLDRDGVDLLEGGGTLLLDSEGSAIGPGHAAFFPRDGQELLSYHFYSAEDNGRAKLGVRRLSWDEQGWPLAGELVTTGSIVEPTRRD